MSSTKSLALSIALACSAAIGCSQRGAEPRSAAAEAAPEALVHVDGSPITERELDAYAERTLGVGQLDSGDPALRRRLLDSMVASRAIARRMARELDAEALAALDRQVALVREELLVKRYLLEEVQAKPVSAQDVADYYKANPAAFAGQVHKRYQLLGIAAASYRADPERAVAAVARAKVAEDWPALLRRARDEEGISWQLATHTQVGEPGANKIESAVAALEPGMTSRLLYLDGAPAIARVISAERAAGLSLEQARGEIRRRLLPAAVREAVKAASESVLAETEVRWP